MKGRWSVQWWTSEVEETLIMAYFELSKKITLQKICFKARNLLSKTTISRSSIPEKPAMPILIIGSWRWQLNFQGKIMMHWRVITITTSIWTKDLYWVIRSCECPRFNSMSRGSESKLWDASNSKLILRFKSLHLSNNKWKKSLLKYWATENKS